MKKIILMMVLAILVVACTPVDEGAIDEGLPQDVVDELPDLPEELPVDDISGGTMLALPEQCANNGGTWLPDSQECEGVSSESCSNMGGNYNECASACRNNPEAVVCTLQCVLVCDFKSEPEPVIEEFSVGPELKECVGVGPQDCMVVNGNNFYDSIEGFEYEEGYYYDLRVEVTQNLNAPADASTRNYELVEVVSKIPVGCTSWYDGCNDCMVEDGVIGGCTRRACIQMDEPKCLAFE